MKKDSKAKKDKKIIFSEEIDGTIGGAAAGMAFVVVAVFVMFNKTYLNNETVTAVIGWLFLLFGTPIALACLLRKAKCDSNRLASGVFVSGIWVLLYLHFDYLWTRIFGLFLLFLAAFLILQEFFFLIYSLSDKRKTNSGDTGGKAGNIEGANNLFALIATILGLVLVAMQILDQLGVM